jgi:hypothetical protein
VTVSAITTAAEARERFLQILSTIQRAPDAETATTSAADLMNEGEPLSRLIDEELRTFFVSVSATPSPEVLALFNLYILVSMSMSMLVVAGDPTGLSPLVPRNPAADLLATLDSIIGGKK